MSDPAPGDVVEVVMMKGLLDSINILMKPMGWVLVRADFLKGEDPDAMPTYLATILPGSATERLLQQDASTTPVETPKEGT